MATRQRYPRGAMIVMSCEHAGLRVHFQKLEDEINKVLSKVKDHRAVREYLEELRRSSILWEAENVFAAQDK